MLTFKINAFIMIHLHICFSMFLCLCDNCVFLPRLFVDIIYMIGYFSMQMDCPECVPSVQCPFYIVLLITQLLKQCNVKRALARDFSSKVGSTAWPATSSAVNRCSDFIALLYWTASSAIVLSKHPRAALHNV